MDAPIKPKAAQAARHCVEVAIAVVFAAGGGNQLLICRRRADTVLPGYWEFPGGKCHPGETPADCVRREVEEETALHVRVLAALGAVEHDYPHARVRLHPFVCEHVGGTLELRAVAEALWIDAPTVDSYRFPEANKELLQQVRLGRHALLASTAAPGRPSASS